jgi:TFIIF-interacting CTD phosphatase-like protein
VVWPQGRDELEEFQEDLNSIHPNIRFTMEMEEDN